MDEVPTVRKDPSGEEACLRERCGQSRPVSSRGHGEVDIFRRAGNATPKAHGDAADESVRDLRDVKASYGRQQRGQLVWDVLHASRIPHAAAASSSEEMTLALGEACDPPQSA
jgi:hypothetical protein